MALNLKNVKIKLDLNSLPKAVKIAIAIVPSAIIVGLFVFLSVVPTKKAIAGLRVQIASQEAEISKSQSMADRLEDLVKQNEMLKQRLIELQKQLPEEREISILLKQVSDLGIESGLRIMGWKPSDRKTHPSGIVYQIPVAVEFQGGYHQLGHFFSALTSLDRIINVSDLKLATPKMVGDRVEMNITFTANTYTAVSAKGLTDVGEKADTGKKPGAKQPAAPKPDEAKPAEAK